MSFVMVHESDIPLILKALERLRETTQDDNEWNEILDLKEDLRKKVE